MGAGDLLQALQRDHVNFGRVLAVLRGELERLERNENPHFELIRDALEYLQEFGNLYHHPKEDAIYKYHLEHHDGGWSLIDKLLDEHSQLERLTEDLRQATEGLLHDAVTRREPYVDKLRSFIERQSGHVEAEEKHIFPLVRDVFSEADWAAVEKAWPTRDDPLFGDGTGDQFKALYARIYKA